MSTRCPKTLLSPKQNPNETGTPIRKVLISAYGDESNVSVIDAILPQPSKNEVQVKVLYSGFSGSDINMRKGQYPLQRSAPLTPGYCLVGHVSALLESSSSNSKFKIGDAVTCLSIYDAEATYVNLPEKYLIPVPGNVPLKAATALILDWNTAYGMVHRAANIQTGQKVFIHGLSGAVGWAVGVLCSLHGAQIFGTASSKNHAAITTGLPAATPFTYENKDWIQAMKNAGGADAVFDPLGFESWDESYDILSPTGILIGYGGNMNNFSDGQTRSQVPSMTKLFARNYLKFWEGRRAVFYYISRDDKYFVEDLEALFGLCGSGRVGVTIKQVFGMRDTEEIRKAHRCWGKGSGVGSLLLRVS
ncbi:hypothetical protein HYALB_00000230 [Hymenoscyphus albidus]|uniref:Enoyl reductase (ER) domain-containing protein n=1 Tax=Hymenoscyphus albidus TaxID=595503 RepID=A0A9N9LPS8_9HELO|nr:hypothetical protein HYALB_00000230 [Hymenoscyphus albidus]